MYINWRARARSLVSGTVRFLRVMAIICRKIELLLLFETGVFISSSLLRWNPYENAIQRSMGNRKLFYCHFSKWANRSYPNNFGHFLFMAWIKKKKKTAWRVFVILFIYFWECSLSCLSFHFLISLSVWWGEGYKYCRVLENKRR